LRQAIKAISAYMHAQAVPLSQAVVRLDGQYGNGAIVADLAGLAYIMRGKDYDLLDLESVQARLAQPPDQQITHPEPGTSRTLFDFPELRLSPAGPCTRVIVATHPTTTAPAPVGTTRGEMVYELFYTALPTSAFTPADVVNLYLHRGAFECVLADEDLEQDSDRWCSHAAWGQEFWLIVAQWVWNLRLELGHALHPTPMRTTEFAPSSMGRRSGHVHRTPKDLPGQISLSSRMGRYAVQQAARSIHKSGDQSAMARSGCCMSHGSVIVVRVRCASSVKNRRRLSKRDGSVRSIGLSLHVPRSQMGLLSLQGTHHLHRFLIRCCGETGSGAFIGERW
jgi:hypothetical protein